MDTKKTGGPAYPCIISNQTDDGGRQVGNHEYGVPGLTMLDHFAGLAMQALIAKAPWYEVYNDQQEEAIRIKMAAVSSGSYAYAAAMIAERERIITAE